MNIPELLIQGQLCCLLIEAVDTEGGINCLFEKGSV